MTRPETSHDQREATCAATSVTTMANTPAAAILPPPRATTSAARSPTAAIRMTADFGSAGLRRAATMPQSRDSASRRDSASEVRQRAVARCPLPFRRRRLLRRGPLRSSRTPHRQVGYRMPPSPKTDQLGPSTRRSEPDRSRAPHRDRCRRRATPGRHSGRAPRPGRRRVERTGSSLWLLSMKARAILADMTANSTRIGHVLARGLQRARRVIRCSPSVAGRAGRPVYRRRPVAGPI